MKYKYNNEWNTITTDGAPGKDGAPGLNGTPGEDGKSAYEYATQGGYTGTEEEFAEKLAEEIDVSGFMNKTNPTGTGSFSLNRKVDTFVGQYSTAEGKDCTASGWYSHAEGRNARARTTAAHAEGYFTEASGDNSHAEGSGTTASGEISHAEGSGTTASGLGSHAEGSSTTASGKFSHVEGRGSTASGQASHAEGYNTKANGSYSHAEGQQCFAIADCSHAEGWNCEANAGYSHVEGFNCTANSEYQHVQGKFNIVDTEDTYAHIVGNGTEGDDRSNAHTLDWSGNGWFAGDVYVGSTSGTNKDEGSKKLATEEYVDNKAIPDLSGFMNKDNPTGTGSLSLNRKSGTTVGLHSTAEGGNNTASGTVSHAEGSNNTASGFASHAEGSNNIASSFESHAEGDSTTASGQASHAEGYGTKASGLASHAEGDSTTASGTCSHAEGSGTIASGLASHVQGRYNVEDSEGVYAHIVGNGSTEAKRSNAHTLDWSGNGWFAGDIYVGGTGQNDEAAEKLATLSEVKALISEAMAAMPNAEDMSF